jgi:hypothetical protein
LIILRAQDNDRVGGTNDRADFGVELEEGHELGPGVGPEPDDRGILGFPFLAELGEGVQRGGFRGRGVDGFEVAGDRRPVFLRGVFERIA